MRKLYKDSRDSIPREGPVLDFMRESLNVPLSAIHFTGSYSAYVVGVNDGKDSEEGTLIFVPNVAPETLGV